MRRKRKTLKSLLKLQQHELDKVRKDLMEQQSMYDETDREIQDTKQGMVAEREFVAGDPLYFQSLGSFLSAAQYKVDLYSYQLKTVEKALEATRERLGEAYQDTKRYEIALESYLKAERDEEAYNESKHMDEIAGRVRKGFSS